jgi:hypothetical protein
MKMCDDLTEHFSGYKYVERRGVHLVDVCGHEDEEVMYGITMPLMQ